MMAPCNSYPLFLSSRHLVRKMVCPILQTHAVEVFQGDGIALFAADVFVVEWQRNILHRIFEVDQIKRLKYKTDHLIAVSGSLRFRQVFD